MSRQLALAVVLFSFPPVLAAPQATIVDGKIVVTGVSSPAGMSVVVAEGSEEDIAKRPPMSGKWSAGKDSVTFAPRFPLRPGTKYRVNGVDKGLTIVTAKSASTAPSAVTRISPSGEIPENTLRFYIHFSAPMPRGDAYKHLELRTESGDKVEIPFLELDNELWNDEQTRLTLLIDPGRIKREVRPRLDFGPVLEDSHSYKLVVRGAWPNLDGRPLGKDYLHSIKAIAPVSTAIDPGKWKLTPPANAQAAVTVSFDRVMDQPLLLRCLSVIGPDGRPLAGAAETFDNDRGWRFSPKERWPSGQCKLHVDRDLEDVCGNRIGQPFEIDALKSNFRDVEAKPADLPFVVKSR